ncbi:MAG: fibronectin type III domain-containing protein [Christensenellales bacterium]
MKKLLTVVLLLSILLPGALAQEQKPDLTYTEPYMVTLNPGSEMNIIWLTKELCEGSVEYGLTPVMGEVAAAKQYEIKGFRTSVTPEGYDPDPAKNPELPVYQLIAKLDNLQPGQVYYYRVTTTKDGENQVGKRYFFKTAPEKGGEFQFALLSDMQLKVKTKETVKFIGQQENDFILFAGDLINTPWKVSEWFNVEGAYEAPGEEDRSFFECLFQDGDNTRLRSTCPYSTALATMRWMTNECAQTKR